MESTGQEENDYATRRLSSLRTWKSRPHGHESGFVGMQVSDRSTIPRSKLLECPHMAELESLLEKARQLAEGRNHKLPAFIRGARSSGSRCVTCARQVYVMPDPGLNGAAIGGDAIAEACIRKPSGSIKRISTNPKAI